MATLSIFGIHRSWEDWLGVLLGALILVSPAFTPIIEFPGATLNVVLVGCLIAFLAWQELTLIERWEEYAELILGVWLIISPWVFGYAGQGTASAFSIVLGVIVALLAVLELWQDRQGKAKA